MQHFLVDSGLVQGFGNAQGSPEHSAVPGLCVIIPWDCGLSSLGMAMAWPAGVCLVEEGTAYL